MAKLFAVKICSRLPAPWPASHCFWMSACDSSCFQWSWRKFVFKQLNRMGDLNGGDHFFLWQECSGGWFVRANGAHPHQPLPALPAFLFAINPGSGAAYRLSPPQSLGP